MHPHYLKLTLLFDLYNKIVKHFVVMSCTNSTPSFVIPQSEPIPNSFSATVLKAERFPAQLNLCQEQLHISLSLVVSTRILPFRANALMGDPVSLELGCAASRGALPDILHPKGFALCLSPFQQHNACPCYKRRETRLDLFSFCLFFFKSLKGRKRN